MRKNFLLFAAAIFFCGLFAFTGSVLGNAFGKIGLFAGAIAGGFIGIVLAAWLLIKWRVVEKRRFTFVVACSFVSFLLAAVLAVTNLSSPVIPLASLLLVGAGAVLGNTYTLRKEEKRSNLAALAGFLSILPALYFVLGSVVKYELGFTASFTLLDWVHATPERHFYFNLVSPVVFIGGILICFVMNTLVRLNFKSIALIIKNGPGRILKINLLMLVVSGLLFASLMTYLLFENVIAYL